MLRTVLSLIALLSIASPAFAGTASNPEILDDPADSDILAGSVLPHLEITKAWVQPSGDRIHFIIQLAALDEVPRDAVYVFHYSFEGGRLYFRANWSADGSELDYFGGMYQGIQGSDGYDQQGNRNYLYLPGGPNQQERIRGDVTPGAPGRIEWSYPMDSYGEERNALTFTGLFVTTYKFVKAEGGNRLQYVDTAVTEQDYVHKVYSPWWSKFVPGPSPLLVLAGVGAVVAVMAGRFRRDP